MTMIEEEEFYQSAGSEEEDEVDSDEELQNAFARGELKPGLVVMQKTNEASASNQKKLIINNIPVLEFKLQQIKLPKTFNWAERLDIVNDVAPLAPEIALQMDEHKTRRERELKQSNQKKVKPSQRSAQPKAKPADDDPVHNDFVREMRFYRQGQEAILKCLPRLKELNVPTKRPDDYFAEMAKSDTHMQKVAKVLHKKQIATERSEKVRKIRQQKKIAKQTQVHVLQERQKSKRELLENVKKYRKGQKNNLDFLNDNKKNSRETNHRGGQKKPLPSRKRQIKDAKYGYGGKKKGSKWNTRESLDGVGESRGKGFRGNRGGVGKKFPAQGGGSKFPTQGRGSKFPTQGRGSFGGKSGKGHVAKRPGKQVRQKTAKRKV